MLQTWWNSAKELVLEVHGTVSFLFTTCILRVLHGSDPALDKRDSDYGTYGNGYRYGVHNSIEHPIKKTILRQRKSSQSVLNYTKYRYPNYNKFNFLALIYTVKQI